jgi:hypothetical protein
VHNHAGFPSYSFTDEAELHSFFGHDHITAAEHTRPIFEKAKDLGVDICIGFGGATD